MECKPSRRFRRIAPNTELFGKTAVSRHSLRKRQEAAGEFNVPRRIFHTPVVIEGRTTSACGPWNLSTAPTRALSGSIDLR